jgi:uncharacterized protein YrrD
VETTDRLRYLEASKVIGPSGDLAGTSLCSVDGQALGEVDGVVVDPSQRRLLYFVVKTPGFFRHRRRLVPADAMPHVDQQSGAVHIDVERNEMAQFAEFEPNAVRQFDDEDVIEAIFSRRTA